jgi:hypothetical protein
MTKRSQALFLVASLATALTVPCTVEAGPPEGERKRAVERMGEQVSRGVVQEGLETLDLAENRARLGRVLNSVEMRDAVHDLTAAFVAGAIEGVAVGSDGKAIRKGIEQQLTPAMSRMVERMIDAALTASLTDEHISRVELLTERATYGAIRGLARGLEEFGPTMAATIRKDLSPAFAEAVERDFLPAVGRGLDTPEMQQVVANLTRSFATEFIGGAGDAIDVKVESDEAAGKTSGFELFGDKVAFGYMIAMFVAFALGTTLIGMMIILFRNSRRLRKQSEAATQREAALLSLIDSLETDHPELRANVRKLLEEQLHV